VSEGSYFFFFQAEDGIRDVAVTGVQTCALPILYVNRRYQLVEGKPLKRNAMLRQKVMIDDPFIASWRLGIQSAKSPPRSRFCRRPQFAQEFKRNVGALNPVRPLRTALLYVFVQLFN